MPICVVDGCHCHSRNENVCQSFPLPKEEKTSQEWLKRINRKDFEPTKNTRVCIKHFDTEAFVSQAKGQLNSECLFGVFKSPKKPTKLIIKVALFTFKGL